MKTLELDLRKKIFIIDLPENYSIPKFLSEWLLDKNKLIPEGAMFLCRGEELTQGLAEDLVYCGHNISTDEVVYNDHTDETNCFLSPYDSFVSAIKYEGYHWLTNPVDLPLMENYGWYSANSPEEESGWMYEDGEEQYFKSLNKHNESETNTFKNPIIFIK